MNTGGFQQQLSPSPAPPTVTLGPWGLQSQGQSRGLDGAPLHAGHRAQCPPSARTFPPDTCSHQPYWLQKTQDKTLPRALNHQWWGEL